MALPVGGTSLAINLLIWTGFVGWLAVLARDPDRHQRVGVTRIFAQ
jgi:hypothetical protein